MQRTSGLNTVLDPERLQQGDRTNGYEIELAEAVNVSIDNRGLPSLRNGSSPVATGEYHSIFCDGGDCFAILEGESSASIVKIHTDFTTSVVRSGLSKGLRMGFAQTNTDTFYSNGVQNGFIRGGVNYSWPVQTYRGPDADVDFATSVPVANHIAFLQGGKCVISVGPHLFLNHEPFKYGLFAPALGFIGFESDVSMICPAKSGFFVSDQRQTWFLRKVDGGWYRYRQELVDTAPAIEWSLAQEKVLLRDIGYDLPGFGRVWRSTEGVCVGTDDGLVFNKTKDKVRLQNGYSRGACLIKDYTVISTVE